MGVHLKETPLTFRRKNKHPLDKLVKLTGKEMEDMVENLVKLSKSQDEKIALGATKEIIDLHVTSVEKVEKDDITRTLAELKMNPGTKHLEIDEDDTPLVNFNEIQEA